MRKLLGLIVVGALAVGLGAPVQASTLAFSGSLAVTVGTFPPLATTGSGTGTSVGGGTANTVSIPSGVFSINVGAIVSPPLAIIGGFAVCAPGVAFGTTLTIPSFTGACASPAKTAALAGTGSSASGALLGSSYLTSTSNAVLGEIPLGVIGLGGSTTFNVLFGAIAGTVTGNAWTTNAITASGALGTAPAVVLTAAGFDNRTASGAGTLVLVTPTFVTLTGQAIGVIPSISVMTLTFVPEPGTLLLLGSGIAGLVVLGRRRMSR